MFKKIHVFRIKPDRKLLEDIAKYCIENSISSAIVFSIIGSVQNARLNFLKELPGKYESVEYTGPLEIVCAQGSISLCNKELVIHIHIQISGQAVCRGGHLAEAIVFSTAEVVIGELEYQLQRQKDDYTGLKELIS